MGLDLLGEGCAGVWAHSRDAIVSEPGLLPRAPQGYGNRARTPEDLPRAAPKREELLLLRTAVERGTMVALGIYPIVTSQYSSTTLYQVSYHIQ